jgi:hypothetical protein
MPRPFSLSIAIALVLVTATRPAVLDAQTTGAAPPTLTPAQERAVLMALFEATGGPTWKHRTGWGSDTPVCQWHGVSCDTPLADVQIVGLELPGNGLRGTAPASLATLPWLHSLDLSGNQLRGPLPQTLIDRANKNELTLRIGGTSLDQALTSITIQMDEVTGVCHGDLNTRMVIDPRRGQATLEAVRCHDNRKRKHATMCVRGTIPAPDLEMLGRALRRLALAKADSSARPDLMLTDHDGRYETSFAWGDGTTGLLSTINLNGPLDVRIAQRLLLQLVPDPGHWKAREVPCSSLPWATWVQD